MNHRALLPYLAGNKHTDDGEGNGAPLQYSCLENPMDGGAWWAAIHGVTKSRTQLSHFTMVLEVSLTFYFLELFLLHICFRFWTRH